MPKDFYKKIAPFYDSIYPMVKFRKVLMDFIEWAFKNLTPIEVKKVLDCGCGTGAQSLPLLESGYDVTASDYSPDMLELAKEKFNAKGFDVRAEVNDIRDLPYDKEFDAVIFIFSAFCHMITTEDALNALESMKKVLKPDGIAVFDIANIIHFIEDYLEENNEHFTIDDNNVFRHIKHRVDSVDCLMTHDEMTIVDNGKEVRTFTGKTDLRIFTKPELDFLIDRVGFSEVHFFRDYDDRGEKTGNSSRLVYVLRK